MTPAASILKHEIVDRPPVRQWGEGRVTMLGDAAHPTTLNLGQGACMAIEDAQVLARCLADSHGDVPARLRRYESSRYPRSAFITRESRRIGLIGQLKNPLAVAMRTAAMKLTPQFLGEMRHRAYFSVQG